MKLDHQRQALFRCDGGPGIGHGHVSRCLALAEALAAANWSCRFAASPETRGCDLLATSGFETIALAQWDSVDCLRNAIGTNLDLLIIDHYGLDAVYEERCRGLVRALMVFDDTPVRRHRCDLLVDAGDTGVAAKYKEFVSDHCVLLLGLDYVCLRFAFAAARKQSLATRIDPRAVHRIFVNFGGVDSRGLCNVALDTLANIDGPLSIDVTISGSAPHLAHLRSLAAASPHNVTLHVDSHEVADLLASTDIALGAAGINAWERSVLGVPSIVVAVADNQRFTYDTLNGAGAALGIGDASEDIAVRMAEAVRTLMSDRNARVAMSAKAAALCDGQGAHRVAATVSGWVEREPVNVPA